MRFEAAAAAGPSVAAGEALAPPQPPPSRTLYGKPLRLTTAWAAVFLIWAGASCGLAAVRLDMGHLTALSQREHAAVVQVQEAELARDVTTGEALAMTLTRFGAAVGTTPQWYVQERPWEDKVYVIWELGAELRLGWTVASDGTVAPGAETELFLKEVVRAGGP